VRADAGFDAGQTWRPILKPCSVWLCDYFYRRLSDEAENSARRSRTMEANKASLMLEVRDDPLRWI
jgi:hypothetical protein